MVALVTLADVKARLKIDGSDEDATLNGYIEAASSAVINYLKGQADVLMDLGNSPVDDVPPLIQTATIMLIGDWVRNPDSDPDKDYDLGYLPKPVMALLYPLRDPALA